MARNFIELKNAKLYMHDFTGNKFGYPNICIKIEDPSVAHQMANDGWNIKESKYSTEDEPLYFLPVEISYKHPRYQPEILYVGNYSKGELSKDEIYVLDDMEIVKGDYTINARVKDDGGIKAFLDSALITIIERNDYRQRYDEYEPNGGII